MAKGVKLKHQFDKLSVGDTLTCTYYVVQCAINWAKRQDNGWKFSSHRNEDYKTTSQVTLTRIK